jgi:hypothetical protein
LNFLILLLHHLDMLLLDLLYFLQLLKIHHLLILQKFLQFLHHYLAVDLLEVYFLNLLEHYLLTLHLNHLKLLHKEVHHY